MAVEGIHVLRETRSVHLPGQRTGASSLGGSDGGGEWDDSPWSLSCTESEDQSSETNAPVASSTSSLLGYYARYSPEQKVVMRHQPELTRRHMQRAKTLGYCPPVTTLRSPSSPPNARKLRPSSGVPAAIGLDCYELRRRSYNSEMAKRLSQISTVAAPTTEVGERGGKRGRSERRGVLRIQSLNRYTTASSNSREACQLSWESLSTKPPRPPTTHSSNTTSPQRSQTVSSEAPASKLPEMANRVEGALIQHQHQQQKQVTKRKLQGSLSFDQATLRSIEMNNGKVATENRGCKPASLPCRIRHQQTLLPATATENYNEHPNLRPSLMRTPLPPQGSDMQKLETAPVSDHSSSEFGMEITPPEARFPQTPVAPVATKALSSTPPKIVDEVAIRNSYQQQQIAFPAGIYPSTTITLYELIQFCHLSSTHVPPQTSKDFLRRNSWEAGELIPGLGIRVSVVSVNFPPHSRPPRAGIENTGPRPLQHASQSAFNPVVGPTPTQEKCSQSAPLVIVIDKVSVSGNTFFQPGQIIVEVNGVNLLVPTTNKQSLLTRLLQVVLAAYNSDGLYITLATPHPHLVRRISREAIEIRLCEQK